jgi:hypothetical protein
VSISADSSLAVSVQCADSCCGCAGLIVRGCLGAAGWPLHTRLAGARCLQIGGLLMQGDPYGDARGCLPMSNNLLEVELQLRVCACVSWRYCAMISLLLPPQAVDRFNTAFAMTI